jgi:hypothetical protein
VRPGSSPLVVSGCVNSSSVSILAEGGSGNANVYAIDDDIKNGSRACGPEELSLVSYELLFYLFLALVFCSLS